MKILIFTHEGTFHSDEITAIALIKAFYAKDEDEVFVNRVNHNIMSGSELRELGLKLVGDKGGVFVIDIGREYNPDNKLFDHHQWDASKGKASAGLVFDYVKELIPESVRDEVYEIVKMSDLQDLGLEKANVGTLPDIITHFNADQNYGKEQTNNFNKALNFTYKYLKAIKDKGLKLEKAKKRIREESKIIDELTREVNDPDKPMKVLEFTKGYIPFWTEVLPTMKEYEDVDIVVWYDEQQDTWKAQTVPTTPGGFDKRGRCLIEPPVDPKGKIFIHKNEFFVVFKTREDLISYLKSL